MEDIRQQQIEALGMVAEYIEKLIPAMKEIIPELRGQELPDTKDFLNQQMDGLNFVIDIINGTMSLVNEKETILIKDNMEEKVQNLNRALGAQMNPQIADVLEADILPFLDVFRQVALVLVKGEQDA